MADDRQVRATTAGSPGALRHVPLSSAVVVDGVQIDVARSSTTTTLRLNGHRVATLAHGDRSLTELQGLTLDVDASEVRANGKTIVRGAGAGGLTPTSEPRVKHALAGPTRTVLALEPPKQWSLRTLPSKLVEAARSLAGFDNPEHLAREQPARAVQALSAADAQRLYRELQLDYGCDAGTRVVGRELGPEDVAAIGRALGRLAPLLQCDAQQVRYVARVNVHLKGCAPRDVTAAAYYAQAGGVIFFYDRWSASSMPGIPVHELAHATVDKVDPIACTTHGAGATPFARAWDESLGWGDGGTKRSASGVEAPPTAYGHTDSGEDRAESVQDYAMAPGKLREKAPLRYARVHELLEAARAKARAAGTR